MELKKVTRLYWLCFNLVGAKINTMDSKSRTLTTAPNMAEREP